MKTNPGKKNWSETKRDDKKKKKSLKKQKQYDERNNSSLKVREKRSSEGGGVVGDAKFSLCLRLKLHHTSKEAVTGQRRCCAEGTGQRRNGQRQRGEREGRLLLDTTDPGHKRRGRQRV